MYGSAGDREGKLGTYYSKLGHSDGDLCAAVARAIVHDAAVNGLGTGGFPEITARRAKDGFAVELRMDKHARSFDVTDAEARRMVATMKNLEQYDTAVFDRIQEAMAQLEGTNINTK